ncbi:Imm8 family immunity protein [Tahibacter amnicola]
MEREIRRYCERCIGGDWKAVAQKVARIGQWEFEDYQP